MELKKIVKRFNLKLENQNERTAISSHNDFLEKHGVPRAKAKYTIEWLKLKSEYPPSKFQFCLYHFNEGLEKDESLIFDMESHSKNVSRFDGLYQIDLKEIHGFNDIYYPFSVEYSNPTDPTPGGFIEITYSVEIVSAD